MSIAIIDARGWQNTLDLRTGEKIRTTGPLSEMVSGVLHRHPYPGDTDPGSNRWVSDTALELIERYSPRFLFLIYSAQYFSFRHTPMTEDSRQNMIAELFSEIERFIGISRFSPIVAGTGSMTELAGFIDVTGLDGLAIRTNWSTRYAGLHEPSRNDLKFLKEHRHVERVIPRNEVVSLFRGTPEDASRVPEYLMLASKGYTFKTLSDVTRTPVMIPALNFHIPLSVPGQTVEVITDIRRVIENDIIENNIALIILEGVGQDEFLWPFRPCRNGTGWFYYEPGEAQYLSITSGRDRFFDYPTGYRFFDESDATSAYPFSGYFTLIPDGTFASTFPGRSIAVGNRSMVTHMVAGADISIECFARNLYNHGTMAVIHREDKVS